LGQRAAIDKIFKNTKDNATLNPGRISDLGTKKLIIKEK
jgi:hypothetical protein